MKNSLRLDYKKIKLLEKYNKFYYQNQSPLVSDKKYDELKNEILRLEKYSFSNLKSPSIKVDINHQKNLKNLNTKLKCYHYLMHLIKKT